MYTKRISEIYQQLSPSYRRVADFILNDYRRAAFMTASQIGQVAKVDTAVVVRFAQRLGYPGYPELSVEIKEKVKRDLRTIYEPAPDAKTPVTIFRRSLVEDRNSLEHVLLQIEDTSIEEIVSIIAEAPRSFIMSEGIGVHLAIAFAQRMVMLGFDMRVIPVDVSYWAGLTAALRPGDAFIGLGMTSLTSGVAAALQIARDEGANTIGIVDSFTNPVARAAQHILQTPVHTAGIMYSLTAFTAVLHGLLQALTVRIEERATEWAMRADHLMQEYAGTPRQPIPHASDIVASFNSPDDGDQLH